MRVLHIIPSVSDVHGGPTEILALMEESLSAAGVSVTTATTDDEGPGCRLPIESRPAELHGAKRIYFRKLFDFYKVAPTMLPWLWHNVPSFDVVHIHALFSFTSAAAALVASWRGVPYIVRPLGTLNQYGMTQRRPWLKRLSMAMLESRILRRAAAVHFTSETEWEEARALNLSLRGIVIPLAVRPGEQGEEQSLLEQHPALRGRQIVLYLSRLDPKKNVEGLLRAFASMKAERDDVALLIAGDGRPDYVASLKALATKLELDDRVMWLGYVAGAQKSAAFAAASVFVLPSLSENFGMAAAEAMLAGLPCVLGEAVAIAKESELAGASLTVTPDSVSIAEALTKIISSKQMRQEMGRRAYQFAQNEYSVQAMADRLIALYRTTGSGRGTAAA